MNSILFVAPASNLQTAVELIRASQGMTVSICDGNVDRSKLEQFLQAGQYSVVHFASHGDLSILHLSDGALEVQDLITMLEAQRKLKLVVITACNSARIGTEIHNQRGIPVVMCQAPIGDNAAIAFSERFYRNYRTYHDPKRAVDAGRATLAKIHPTDADVVTLINGDMATHEELSDCMGFVREELGDIRNEMSDRFASLESNVDGLGRIVGELRNQQGNNLWLIVLVGALLLVNAVSTINGLIR